MRYKVDKLDDEDDSDSGTSLDVFSVTSSMEIDPHKMGDASDSAINTLELWLAAQKLFKCIVNSERLMPTQIKHILMHIDAEVGERFSAQEQFRALGGFLFLRMVCPALMAPQVFGLLDNPPHPVRALSSCAPCVSCVSCVVCRVCRVCRVSCVICCRVVSATVVTGENAGGAATIHPGVKGAPELGQRHAARRQRGNAVT
jgi:hypothetical protein